MDLYEIVHELEKIREFVRGGYMANDGEGTMESFLYVLRGSIDDLLRNITEENSFPSND